MSLITLIKYFPWISSGSGDWRSPWVYYPEELGDCQLWVVVETFETGTATVQLQSSVDAVAENHCGSSVSASALGTTASVREITGSYVRLHITSTGTVGMTLSVYVVPKRS